MTTSGWGALSRMAVRQVRRHRARSVLAVLLIALPVGILVFASIVVHTTLPSKAELVRNERGAAAEKVQYNGDLRSFLQPGERAVAFRSFGGQLLDGEEPSGLPTTVTDLPLDDPLTKGMLVVHAGRVPKPGEIALSPRVASVLNVTIGEPTRVELESFRFSGQVWPDRPPEPVRHAVEGVVAGIVVDPEYLSSDIVVVGEALPFVRAQTWLTSVPGVLHRADEGGGWQSPEDEVLTEARTGVLVIGSLGLMVFGLVVSAVFASGARRQLQTSGLLSATGASSSHVRRLFVLQGLVAAALGVAMGILIGFLGVAAITPHLDRITNRLTGGPEVGVVDLGLVVIVALVVAGLAADAPGRSIARLPTMAALGGRPARVGQRHDATAAGLACFAMGTAVIGANGTEGSSLSDRWIVSVLGTALLLVGVVLTARWLVHSLERVGRRAPAVWRLALRHLSRQSSRGAPMVAAIAASGAVAIAAATVTTSGDVYENNGAFYYDASTERAFWLALAVGFALAVIAIGLPLLNAEAETDRALLSAVGAGSRSQRQFATIQAAVVAALGGVLGVVAGYVPSVALLMARDGDYPIILPTAHVLALTIGVPVVVAVAAGIASRPVRPDRILALAEE